VLTIFKLINFNQTTGYEIIPLILFTRQVRLALYETRTASRTLMYCIAVIFAMGRVIQQANAKARVELRAEIVHLGKIL